MPDSQLSLSVSRNGAVTSEFLSKGSQLQTSHSRGLDLTTFLKGLSERKLLKGLIRSPLLAKSARTVGKYLTFEIKCEISLGEAGDKSPASLSSRLANSATPIPDSKDLDRLISTPRSRAITRYASATALLAITRSSPNTA